LAAVRREDDYPSFDFASRAMPGEVAQRGSACSKLGQRGARNGGELIEQAAIDQPATHRIHWILAFALKTDRAGSTCDRGRGRSAFPWRNRVDADRKSRPRTSSGDADERRHRSSLLLDLPAQIPRSAPPIAG
jgi:hypothetical protein